MYLYAHIGSHSQWFICAQLLMNTHVRIWSIAYFIYKGVLNPAVHLKLNRKRLTFQLLCSSLLQSEQNCESHAHFIGSLVQHSNWNVSVFLFNFNRIFGLRIPQQIKLLTNKEFHFTNNLLLYPLGKFQFQQVVCMFITKIKPAQSLLKRYYRTS